jgi:hypothetical protein
MEVHCVDLNPHSASANGGYEDVSKVQKYKMSDEDYDKKKGTLRDWAKHQKAADPKFSLQKHAKEHQALVEANRIYKTTGQAPPGFSFVNGKLTADKKEVRMNEKWKFNCEDYGSRVQELVLRYCTYLLPH